MLCASRGDANACVVVVTVLPFFVFVGAEETQKHKHKLHVLKRSFQSNVHKADVGLQLQTTSQCVHELDRSLQQSSLHTPFFSHHFILSGFCFFLFVFFHFFFTRRTFSHFLSGSLLACFSFTVRALTFQLLWCSVCTVLILADWSGL